MNRRVLWVGVAAVAGVLFSQAARADDSVPPPRANAEPATGVPFVFRTGFYTELQLGYFTVFGGSGVEKPASSGQAYEAVSIGYEIPIGGFLKQVSIFLTAAHGPNAGSCRVYDPNTYTSSTNGCETYNASSTDSSPLQAPENFSTFPIEVGARLGFHEFLPRMFPYVMASFGYTLFTPTIYYGAPSGAPHFGVGGGVQYGTRLDGLSVGLELLFRGALLSPMIPSLAVYPRVAYVF